MGEKMNILTKEKLNEKLQEYYATNYGESSTDVWYEQPAANVWDFKRGEKYIALRAHILTGKVKEFVE